MVFRTAKFLLALCFVVLLISGCSSPEEKEAAYIKRGNAYFDEGKFDKARVEYKNAARIRPGDPEPVYRIGLVEEAVGNYRAAFGNFTHAEQQNAGYAPALLKLGQYFLAAEQYDEVKKRVDTVLLGNKDDPGGHALLGAMLLNDKKYEDAEKECRSALAKDPSNIIAHSVLVGIYLTQGDDEKAIAAADDGIAQNPKSLPLLLLKSKIYERKNNLPKIAETFERIFILAPEEPHYRFILASLYLKAGNIDEAEKALRAGTATLPNDWDMKQQLVLFLNDRRGLAPAEKQIRDYMKEFPTHTELYNWLVDLYVSHGQTDQAIKLLQEIVASQKSGKQYFMAQTALARIAYIKGNRDEAAKTVAGILHDDPNNLDARFLRAHMEADKGEFENAVANLRIILRDRPHAKEALRYLAEILLRQGHLNLAIDTLDQLSDIDPLDYNARVRLAQLYHLNGDSRHALELLRSVTESNAKVPVAWESTARVAIDKKDWDTAQDAIKHLDAFEGQSDTAAFLRGKMLALRGQPDEALAQYSKILNSNPSSSVAGYALAALVEIYKSQGKIDEATKYIESIKDKNPAASTLLGESYLAQGKNDLAAQNFDLAITAGVADQSPYLDRARMFLYEKKTDEALDILRKGAAAVPGDIRAPLMQAQILSELGRYREAITIYEDLLERNADMEGVANNLAEIIADYAYNDPAALQQARNIASRFATSSNPLLLDTLAWVYYRQGDIEQASTVMERAMSMKGDIPPQIHYHYGAILVKADKRNEAKDQLEKATVRNATYPGLDEAKKLLSNL